VRLRHTEGEDGDERKNTEMRARRTGRRRSERSGNEKKGKENKKNRAEIVECRV
jgi:hypothetical protein